MPAAVEPDVDVVSFGGVFIANLLDPTLCTGLGKNNVFHENGENRHGIVTRLSVKEPLLPAGHLQPKLGMLYGDSLN